MISLSVVIPAYNASATIIKTIESIIGASKCIKQIIVVDDCSNDNTYEIVKNYKIKNSLDKIIELYRLQENSGPSIARQVGFSKVTSEYTIFFDADDYMKPNVIDPALEKMEAFNIPVALCTYEINQDGKISGMWPEDQYKFQKLLTNGEVCSPGAIREALLMTNYPWNKICKTIFLKEISLDFGNFRLHEDVLLHWQILLNSKKILLVNNNICCYVLPSSGNNATHEKSSKRLICIDVLDWLYKYIKSKNSSIRIQSIYLEFVYILTEWAYNQIDSTYKIEFKAKLKQLLLKLPFLLIVKNFDNKSIFNFIYKTIKQN